MIDRLQEVLPYLEHLPLEAQEEAATYIESLVEALESEAFFPGRIRSVPYLHKESAEQWQDLSDTILDELDQLRHANPPTPPLEEL